MAANEVPIDLVMRARDEMSAVLDKVVRESDALAISFDQLTKETALQGTNMQRIIPFQERLASAIDTTSKRAKDATGIRWDATVNRWRDANSKFITSQEAAAKGFRETDREAYAYKKSADAAASATDKLGKSMDGAKGASASFKAGIVAVGNVAADLAMKALAAVGSAVSDVASAMINGNAEFERYTVQFGVLLGGADNAKKRLAELAEFGAKTPFELPEVVRADKILQSFGLHSEESAKKFGFSGTQIRTIAGDLAAGTGQGFEDMSRYLGMFASGATGEAISRFQELGITTREELAKMGLEFSKSGELTTPTQEAFTVLLNVAQKKFGGMMDAQSQTFEGMVSNLEDWKGQTLRLIGEPIFEVLREKLGVVLEFLNRPETKEAITNFANGIAETLSTVITWVETNWPTIQAVITGVFDAISWGYNNVLKPIIDFAIGLFGDLFANTQEDFGAIGDTITNVMDGVMDIVDSVLGYIWDLWEDNGKEIFAFVRETWNSISDIINGVVAVVLRVIEINMPKIKDTINQYLTAARVIFETVWAAIKIIVGTALDLIRGVVDTILKLVNGDTEGALNTIKDTFFSIWNRIYTVVEELIIDVKDVIDEYLKKSGTSIDEILTPIKKFILDTWQDIKDKIEDFVSGAVGIYAIVTGAFYDMQVKIKELMSGAAGIYATIVDKWEDIKDDAEWWINTLKNRTAALFQETKDDLILKMNGIISTIVDPWESAKGTVEGWVTKLKDGVVGIFGGMRDGITSAFNTAIQNIKDAIRSVINLYNSIAPTLGMPTINTGFLGSRASRADEGRGGNVQSRTTNFNITAQYGYQDERSLRDDVRTLQMLYGGA